jgi:hypothetical protein
LIVTALLTVDDIMAELKVERSTAYEYMRQMVRVVLSGTSGAHRNVRVTRAALDAWIKARTVDPAPPPPEPLRGRSVRTPAPPSQFTMRVGYPRRKAAPDDERLRVTYPRRRKATPSEGQR